MGCQFKRQRPVGDYIVDFVCLDLMLIIEVDGITHTFDCVKERDSRREANLRAYGFEILRFTDDAVYYRLPDVAEEIGRVVVGIRDLSR